MALQNDTSRIQYNGNNSTASSYAIPFVFFENAHIKCVVTSSAGVDTTLTLGSGFNVTGAGNANGGSLTTTTAVPSTSKVTIFREVPATQTTSYQEGGDFPAESHERALDKLTMLAQQTARLFDRALKVPETQENPNDLPNANAGQKLLASNNGTLTWEDNRLPPPYPSTAGTNVLVTAGSGTAASWQTLPSIEEGPITATGSTTPRFLSDRFAEVVNVKDFGAVGDGVTDDSAAIRAALYHASNFSSSVVKFPAGNYYFNTFDDGTTSTIKDPGSTGSLVKYGVRLTATTNKRMHLIGESATISTPLWIENTQPYPNAAYVILMQIYGLWDFEMEGLEFRSLFGGPGQRPLTCERSDSGANNASSYAFNTFGLNNSPTTSVPKRVKVHNCKFYDFTQAINFWSGESVEVRRCHFEWTWGAVSAGGQQIDWTTGVGCRHGVGVIHFCDNVCIAGPEDFTPILNVANGTNEIFRTADNAILNAGCKKSIITGNYCYRFAYEALATGELNAADKLSNMHVVADNVVDGTSPTGANWKLFGRGGNDGIVVHGPGSVIANNNVKECAVGIWLASGFGSNAQTVPNDIVVANNVVRLPTDPLFTYVAGISLGGGTLCERIVIDGNLILAPELQPYLFNGNPPTWDGKVGTFVGNISSSAAMVLAGSVYNRKVIVQNNAIYAYGKADSSLYYGAINVDAETDFINNYVEGWDFVFWRSGGGNTTKTCRGLKTRNIKRILASPTSNGYESIHFHDIEFQIAPTETGWHKLYTSNRRGVSMPLNISVGGEQGFGDTRSTDGISQQTRLLVGTNDRWDSAIGGEMITQLAHQINNDAAIDKVAVRLGYGKEISAHLHVKNVTTKFALAFSGGGGSGAAGYASPVIGVTGASSTDILTTATPHKFVNGDKVRFTELTGGSGVSVGTNYYVINSAASTLQLATSAGGSPIALGSDITAAVLTSTDGSLQSVTITNPGSNYSSAPTATVDHIETPSEVTSRQYHLSGEGASFVCTVAGGAVSSVAIASRGKQYASKILLQSGVMQESPNSSAFYGIAEESVSAPSSLIMSLKPNQMFQVYSKTAGASPTGYGTPQSGTAAPSVDPEFIGQQFIDTSNKNVYVATGTTAADWAQLN